MRQCVIGSSGAIETARCAASTLFVSVLKYSANVFPRYHRTTKYDQTAPTIRSRINTTLTSGFLTFI
jgi:hypothetical protein